MSKWVGVIVFTGEDWKGESLSPLIYTTGAKDDQDAAMGAGMRKAAGIMRRSATVARRGDDVESLLAAAERMGTYGAAHWTGDDSPREGVVKVSELSDDVRL